MLRVDRLVKTFGSVPALSDVSLEINKGEFFGLLGPNGAGKTTLMNIIVGYTEPDSGQRTIEDEIVPFENVSIRTKMGYVPQEIALYQELSAYQNLQIFGSFYNLPSDVLEKKILDALELVQLSKRKKDPVKDFSGGMKRRLNIAASILHDPQILLCDEPTVGVDPQSRNAIFDMLRHLNSEGKTIVYTTHYMEETERLCTRLAIIDNGKIIANGTAQELINLLEKTETIKIYKAADTFNKKSELENLGSLIDHESYFEILPREKFGKYSAVFNYLEELKIPKEQIELSRATLEDVFLHLTGRSLRD